MPAFSTPDPSQIAQTTSTLADVKEYLRGDPPVTDALPLLEPLLDKDTGVPVLLGDILRDAARLASDQSGLPETDEIRLIIDGLREAAQEATDWHVLHWDLPRLHQHFTHSATPQDER
ncbi:MULTISPECIES: hypothetical protein [Streptomyces]|uniref:Uncharacterized protein n=1 Tax=Streptomyces eurythermus TaxID=42237 RepID=A0ABW6Z5M7_9ACTN|nr:MULTISPECIES: hypothetical protein [Streptomyces]QIS75016.1 hypothetical protein HB370_37790 [Streptomyces sp. DSM 40868]